LKPLLISTSDIEGGAAKAAYRLHTGLKLLGIDSKMLVGLKYSDDIKVIAPTTKLGKGMAILSSTLDNIPLGLYRKRERTIFSPAWVPENIAKKVSFYNPDIIHLHWIAGGFLRIETLRKFHKPIVWTLHDMWAFTGGCHYDNSCGRYKESCGICPQLGSKRQSDLSHWVWKRKMKTWKDLDITIVTPSRWLAKSAQSSSLFKNHRIEVIPHGLDIQRFKPIDKKIARDILSLPRDKKLILFGAVNSTTDKRKGFHLLIPALKVLTSKGWHKKIELIVFGSSKPHDQPDFGFKVNYLGQLKDEISLAVVYAAADVFVLPSIQENLANVIMEAMACGTPCVAFHIGGMPDMIEHEHAGYLAQPFETEELAHGISWILDNDHRREILSRQARQKVEQKFEIKSVAQRYINLYNELFEKQRVLPE
jgi:glycosyltransferase involved in cell wall biosynthesis